MLIPVSEERFEQLVDLVKVLSAKVDRLQQSLYDRYIADTMERRRYNNAISDLYTVKGRDVEDGKAYRCSITGDKLIVIIIDGCRFYRYPADFRGTIRELDSDAVLIPVDE